MNLGTQINQEETHTEKQATPHLPRPALSSGMRYPAETVLLSCPYQSHKLHWGDSSLKGYDIKKALAGASTFNGFVWISCVEFRAGAWDPVQATPHLKGHPQKHWVPSLLTLPHCPHFSLSTDNSFRSLKLTFILCVRVFWLHVSLEE